MASPADVADLLARLGKVHSPMARLRLLARAWRQIRALSPDERAVLADAVGLPGAERFLARIAGRTIPIGDLIRSLSGANDDDPGALRGILRSMGDDEGRRSLLRRGRETIADALSPVIEPATDEPDPAPEPEPEPEPERDSEPVPEWHAEPDPEPVFVPSPLPVPFPAAPVGVVSPDVAPAVPDASAVDRPDAAPALDPVTVEVEEGPSMAELLREFETIGPSWARRRDVLARIEAGEIRSVAELEPFLSRIDGAGDRRWCTLALVEHGGLTRDDLDRLVRDTSDVVVRRRAARHADAATG